MNPNFIYTQYRDDALAKQVTATEYSIFVAMPFRDSFSYRSSIIYTDVIQAAAIKANDLMQELSTTKPKRRFAKPKRVDDKEGAAIVITEAIVSDILYDHLFIGDLTFQNPGVLLEVGIAMGLNSNKQIILITQGDLHELHFDLRNNTVLSYNSEDAITRIAKAMITAAESFETDINKYIELIKNTLTPDAVITLKKYGVLQKEKGPAQSLHLQVADLIFGKDKCAQERFEAATRDLLSKRLILTEYQPNPVATGDAFGMHATKLGWVFIENLWPELARQRK